MVRNIRFILLFGIIFIVILLINAFAIETDGFVFPVIESEPINPNEYVFNTFNPLVTNWKGYGVGDYSATAGHLGQDYYLKTGQTAYKRVYAIANGVVVEITDNPDTKYGWFDEGHHGWGRVIVIKHNAPTGAFFNTTESIVSLNYIGKDDRYPGSTETNPTIIYSLYGHLSKTDLMVKKGDIVKKGQPIARIGSYPDDQPWPQPHLHFEIKPQAGFDEGVWDKDGSGRHLKPQAGNVQGIGSGYSYIENYAPERYIPSVFIKNNALPSPNKFLIKSSDPQAQDIYWFQNDKLYKIISPSIIDKMTTLEEWSSVLEYSTGTFQNDILGKYPIGPSFISADSSSNGLLIRLKDDDKVYLIENSKRRWIISPQVFNQCGYNWNDIIDVTPDIFSMFPEGDSVAERKWPGQILWQEAGVPICVGTNTSYFLSGNHSIISDGNSGAIICWIDYRSPYKEGGLYAQKIDENGNILWKTQGIPICTFEKGDPSSTIQMINDGSGGAIVVWIDRRYPDPPSPYDLFAQRIDGNGNVLWKEGGVPVCVSKGEQSHHLAISDNNGGVIIVWRDMRGNNSDIYAQRIDKNGVCQWAINGIPVCEFPGWEDPADITSDGVNGVIITWNGSYTNNFYKDVYAQRINGNGEKQWGINGIMVWHEGSIIDGAVHATIQSDNSGGAVIVWSTLKNKIYAQQVDKAGVIKWTNVSVRSPINWGLQPDENPLVVSNHFNGFTIIWNDSLDYNNSKRDIYIQKLNSSGLVEWLPRGIPACTEKGDQWINSQAVNYKQRAFCNESGETITAWEDYRDDLDGQFSGSNDSRRIYAQKIDLNGNMVWERDGILINYTDDDSIDPKIVDDGKGGMIITWWGRHGNNNYDNLYTQRINDKLITIPSQSQPKTIFKGIKDFIDLIIDSTISFITFKIDWPGSNLDLALIKPDGARIDPQMAEPDPNIAFSSSTTSEFYTIQSPMPGKWTLEVTAVDVAPEGEKYTASVTGTSTLLLKTETDKPEYLHGEPIKVLAKLTDPDPVLGATVSGEVQPPSGSSVSLAFSDNGTNGDDIANDGIYTSVYSNTSTKGEYVFNIVAKGKTKTNEDFSRTASVSTSVDKDSDNDSIPDVWEDINQLDKFNNDAQNDPDNDTLNNLAEYQHNTNPQKSDTDGDGYSDTEEIQAGSNPNDKNSIPVVLKPPVLEALGMKQTGSTVVITFKNTGEQPAYLSKITKISVPSGIKCSDALPMYLSSEIQPGTTAIATLHFNTINRVRLGFNLEWQDNKGNIYSK